MVGALDALIVISAVPPTIEYLIDPVPQRKHTITDAASAIAATNMWVGSFCPTATQPTIITTVAAPLNSPHRPDNTAIPVAAAPATMTCHRMNDKQPPQMSFLVMTIRTGHASITWIT